MSKIDPLADIAILGGALTSNNDKIEAAFENTLSRDGSVPNSMQANFDINGYRILNLPTAVSDNEPVTLGQAALIAGVENPLTADSVGAVLYPQTAVELSASVTPESYVYPPGHVLRYYDNGGDYSTAILNALKSGEEVYLVPGADHPIDSTVTYTGSSCIIRGNNATISPSSAVTALSLNPTATGVSTTLASDAQVNTYGITVTDTTGFNVGDLISVQSSAAWEYNPSGGNLKRGEMHRIQAITGSIFTLDSPLYGNYDTGSETVTITAYTPNTVYLENFTVDYAVDDICTGIGIYNANDSVVKNVCVNNAATTGIYISHSYNTALENCNVHGANRASYGYGIQIDESYNVWVHNSHFTKSRRGIDISGTFPSRKCGGVACSYDGTGTDTAAAALTGDNSGFGAHETAEFCTFEGCTISNVKDGFLLRGANLTVNNCEAVGDVNNSFAVVSRGANMRVTNNRYSAALRPRKTLDVVAADDDEQKLPWFVYISNPEAWDSTTGTYIHVADNHVEDIKNGFFGITISTDSGGTSITEFGGLKCLNNTMVFGGSTATTTVRMFDVASGTFTLKNSYVHDNVIRLEQDAATFEFVDTGLTLDSTVSIKQPKWGATASVADGGTITHGHIKTPSVVLCTASTSSEFISVTAIGATTFTVAIKKDDGTAGTTQTVYWLVDG